MGSKITKCSSAYTSAIQQVNRTLKKRPLLWWRCGEVTRWGTYMKGKSSSLELLECLRGKWIQEAPSKHLPSHPSEVSSQNYNLRAQCSLSYPPPPRKTYSTKLQTEQLWSAWHGSRYHSLTGTTRVFLIELGMIGSEVVTCCNEMWWPEGYRRGQLINYAL